jgi:hypothetical protein
MDDDNIFDEDDVLDYIIYEDVSKEESNKNGTGCLSLVVVNQHSH